MRWKKPPSVLLGPFRRYLAETFHIASFELELPGPAIFRLPMELLLQIISYLELPSQVCFAMSNKGYYQLFGSVLQADGLSFPRLSLTRKGKYNEIEEYRLRSQLLIQLENDRWAFCAGCQKLHPCEGYKFLIYFFPPRRRLCFTWSSLVDFCPCITLTPRDRKHVMEYLMGTVSDEGRISRINKGVWKGFCDERGKRYLLHECRAYSRARVEIRPSITPNGHLFVCTRYELPSTALRIEPLYACHHGSLLDHMPGIVESPGTAADCAKCPTHMVNVTDPKTPKLTVATITRDLGRNSFPQTQEEDCYEAWLLQARPRFDYIVW